ncbi:MAG: teichoic acid biosynthesis protein [Planctomycetota bacterium]|nr:teichoic acid biosynthesis protein [Planctomycetota bacterium]
MARLFYSMAGEGRGHAARARTLVELLRPRHRITLFTPGDAHALLAPLYAGTDVEVVELPGLRFRYNRRQEVAFLKTGAAGARYLWNLNALVAGLRRRIDADAPDLAIVDFEPALPRAARASGLPFVSVSHQHFLVCCDLSALPFHLRAHARFMSLIVKGYYRGQRETVVSSFYFPPLKRGNGPVTQVGVLLRPAVRDARPRDAGHLLVYLRRFGGPRVLGALKACGLPVRVYGLGAAPPDGALQFLPVDDRQFLDDLAACRALVSTAGNQLVGEALYLGKPVFALPEPRNYEQYINAHFLKASGAGDWTDFHAVEAARLRGFLGRLDFYQARIDRGKLDGNHATLEAIGRNLNGKREEA